MAIRTATNSGNLHDAVAMGWTWADGDTLVVNSGVTVTVAANATAGSNAAAVGHGVTINGTLIVADGVTLTLRGYDATSNRLMLVNRYGVFAPAPGATVVVDLASNYQSTVSNLGIISSVGTALKPVTWDIPAGQYNWATAISGSSTGTWYKYDPTSHRCTYYFGTGWISNATHTGIGSTGNSSIVFSAVSDAAALQHEVASPDLVLLPGDYYVNYQIGWMVYYTTTVNAGASFSWSAYNLTRTGWGIVSNGAQAGNQFTATYTTFSGLGAVTNAVKPGVALNGHKSTAVAADRRADINNCTFRYGTQILQIKNCDGTAADYLDFTHNSIIGAQLNDQSLILYPVELYQSPSSYIDFSYLYNESLLCIKSTITGAANQDVTGIKLNNVTGTMTSLFAGGSYNLQPGLQIKNCDIAGMGSAANYNWLESVGGAEGNPVIVQGNSVRKLFRAVKMLMHITVYDNLFERTFHHGIFSTAVGGGVFCMRGISIKNNRFVGDGGFDNPVIHSGYNGQSWWDDYEISNNTISINNATGAFCYGDPGDAGSVSVPIYGLFTRGRVFNNLSNKGGFFRANNQTTYKRDKLHVSLYDYNLDYNPAGSITGGSACQQSTVLASGGDVYNIQTTGKNIPGLSLHQPSAIGGTGKTISFAAAGKTLAWDGGAPVSILRESGTLTADAVNNSTYYYAWNATVTDTGKAWATDGGTTAPVLTWIKITSGVAAGEIRAVLKNTATTLTVVPAWTTGKVPLTGASYELWETEVTLTGATGGTIQAGVYLPEWTATADASDTGLSVTDHHLTVNPQLTNEYGLTKPDMIPLNASIVGQGYLGSDIGAVEIPVDITSPTVTEFVLPSSVTGLTVPVTSFTATDTGVGVTGYAITTTGTAPTSGWTGTAPTSVIAPGYGTVTFYAWAKDAADNISSSRSATVVVSEAAPPDPPPVDGLTPGTIDISDAMLTVIVDAVMERIAAMGGIGVTAEDIAAIDAALSASHGAGLWTGGGSGGGGNPTGPGALIATVSVTDETGAPLDGVACWVTTDSSGSNVVAGTLYTSAFGTVDFTLDAGSYYLWRQRAGMNFTNPTAFSVA